MEDATANAAESSGAGTKTGHTSPRLLEVQSEQLAMKLQREADKDVNNTKNQADSNTTTISGGVRSDFEASTAAVAAQDSSSLQQPIPSQGAWGTPGRSSAADFLRSTNPPTTPTTAPRPSAPTSSQLAAAAAGGASSAVASLVVVPLSAESVGAMVGMGIEEEWAAAALRRCGGADVTRAVEFCFSNDMKALAEEDARTLEKHHHQQQHHHHHQQQPQQQPPQQQPDTDSDLAFAVALDQEERRVFEARRSAAAATLATEQGTFGSKVRFAAAPAAPAFAAAANSSGSGGGAGYSSASSEPPRPQRWGVAEAEAMMDGDGELFSPEGDGFYEDDISGGGAVEEDGDEGGGGFRAVPGGGRRKGKMPLFRNAEGEVVSKHDAVICGRMNARDASNLEGVGDLTAAGVRLGNRTFNSLKRDIRKKKEKGMSAGGRVEGATRSTQEGVMDSRTRLLVFKMVNAGTLLEVHGMVKTGKEAHVYHALAYEDPEALTGSRGVALKIFKTTLSEFGNRAAYVDGDPRYGSMRFNKQSRQKMFAIWAKKEHRNLLRLYRAGVPCPEPIKQRDHTLVLSFIGRDHWPAPQLREIDLSKGNWRRCYAQVLELARMMFKKCHLVHADLSEYNVLYHEKVCHVIDVGQAVDTGHPKALEFLRRDLSVVSSFFRRKEVAGCLADGLAERFVVGYPGPFSSEEDSSNGSGRVDDHGRSGGKADGGADGGEGTPLAGVELVLELMGVPADEVEAKLRAAFAAAEPWAARAAAASKQAGRHGDSDLSDDENENDNDTDNDSVADGGFDYAAEEGREGAGDGVGGDRNLEGKTTGDADAEDEEDWTVVDAEDADVDGEGAGEGKGKREKVELSERERTRTATEKEALKAGIF